MKTLFHLVKVVLFCLIITSCSPIDSLKPFDQQQAAVLVKNMQKKYERSKKHARDLKGVTGSSK